MGDHEQVDLLVHPFAKNLSSGGYPTRVAENLSASFTSQASRAHPALLLFPSVPATIPPQPHPNRSNPERISLLTRAPATRNHYRLPKMSDPTTPLMQQYQAIKSRYPHALLLFRLGDFYELFYEDAILASRELQITLTSRNREKGQPIPMCGVPYHAADGYIARLIRAGFKIAICDQMEAPGPGKKLVRREVVRVITPGTATDVAVLDARENNFLAAASRRTPLARRSA